MKIQLTKMHGLGNDFILLDDRQAFVFYGKNCEKLAKKLCDRHFGIGADGLILVGISEKSDMAFRIYNSDGSQAGMCGNGIRCFVKLLYEKAICRKKKLLIETQAGLIRCFLQTDEKDRVVSVRVDMGEPGLAPEDIPVLVQGKGPSFPIRALNREFFFTPVSMGNPHAVFFTEEVHGFTPEILGPIIETHELFPQKTNVEFVEILSPEKLKMRVWERGVGFTMACGTGACASLVAANLTGRAKKKAEILLPGGKLWVEWDESSNHVFMTGPAEKVFDASMEI